MSRQYINFNGTIVPSDQQILTSSNRGFRYGDGLFESMRLARGELRFPELHIDRVRKGMKVLKIDNWSHIDAWFLKENAEELVRRNKTGPEARIRLTIYRDSGGLYNPASNKMGFIMEASAVPPWGAASSDRGLIIDIYEELTKPVNIISNLKTCNSLIYVMAGIFKNQQGIDEVLVLNQNGFLCEAMSSNVFVVYDRKVYTPSLYEGCIAGVMRQVVIKLARENNIPLIEGQINPDILSVADEVFLTNAVTGIRWVMGYNNKRYFNEVSKFLSGKLAAI